MNRRKKLRINFGSPISRSNQFEGAKPQRRLSNCWRRPHSAPTNTEPAGGAAFTVTTKTRMRHRTANRDVRTIQQRDSSETRAAFVFESATRPDVPYSAAMPAGVHRTTVQGASASDRGSLPKP